MLKNIFAVIGGFVLWTAFWLASDFTLLLISPDWYGEGLQNFTTPILLISLVRSIFISIIAGYVASLIAKKNQIQTALVLGVLLFAFGVFIQAQYWSRIPLWYHLIFLGLLIPMTYLGAKTRQH